MILSDVHLTKSLEADLRSEYDGVDIGQYWRRDIPVRKFLNLVAQLPDTSRTVRGLTRQPDGVSTTDQLIITLINEQRQWMYMWHCSKLDKNQTKPDKPKMVELPDPMPLDQSTIDYIEKCRAKADSDKWKDYDFATISDVARMLGGGL